MKLAIAAALSHDPKLLVLDEATEWLDPIVRDEILDIFNDFTRDESHSVLISSHIVSDLRRYAITSRSCTGAGLCLPRKRICSMKTMRSSI